MLFNSENIQKEKDKPNAYFTAFTSGNQIHDLDVRVGSDPHNFAVTSRDTLQMVRGLHFGALLTPKGDM